MKVKSAVFVKSCVLPSQFPVEIKPEIAFVGRSNVGKSSLINRLLDRKNLAKISSKPGKTRTLNYFLINESFFFVDLPGYGFAKVPKIEKEKWAGLIEGFLKNRKQLILVVQLIDIRHEPTEDDRLMMEWHKYYGIPIVVAATKSDKLSKNRLTKNLSIINKSLNIDKSLIIPFSTITGQGKSELWTVIEDALNKT